MGQIQIEDKFNNDNEVPNPQIQDYLKVKCKECKKHVIPLKYKLTSIKLCETCYMIHKKIKYEHDIRYKGNLQINQITPKLFLGNNEGAKSLTEWKQYGITNVLVVGYYWHEYYPNDFIYKTIEIEDNDKEDWLTPLIPALDFIERAEKCYVHCRAGISRSSSIVIAYIMLISKMSFEDAKNYVKAKRNEIEPNQNFERQLKKFGEIWLECDYKYRLIKHYFRNLLKTPN